MLLLKTVKNAFSLSPFAETQRFREWFVSAIQHIYLLNTAVVNGGFYLGLECLKFEVRGQMAGQGQMECKSYSGPFCLYEF